MEFKYPMALFQFSLGDTLLMDSPIL